VNLWGCVPCCLCPSVILGSVCVLNVFKHYSMFGSNFVFLIVTSLGVLEGAFYKENMTRVFY